MSQELPPLSPRLQALEAIDARTRRNRRLAVAGLLLVLLAAIVAGFFVYRTWLYQVKIGADLRRDLIGVPDPRRAPPRAAGESQAPAVGVQRPVLACPTNVGQPRGRP